MGVWKSGPTATKTANLNKLHKHIQCLLWISISNRVPTADFTGKKTAPNQSSVPRYSSRLAARRMAAEINRQRAFDARLRLVEDQEASRLGDVGSAGPWELDANRNTNKIELPPWRIHDLRRTCATGMAEIGIAPHVVEACLNHVSGAKAGVAGTYDRAAYATEKRIAFDPWAAHIVSLTSALSTQESPKKSFSTQSEVKPT